MKATGNPEIAQAVVSDADRRDPALKCWRKLQPEGQSVTAWAPRWRSAPARGQKMGVATEGDLRSRWREKCSGAASSGASGRMTDIEGMTPLSIKRGGPEGDDREAPEEVSSGISGLPVALQTGNREGRAWRALQPTR